MAILARQTWPPTPAMVHWWSYIKSPLSFRVDMTCCSENIALSIPPRKYKNLPLMQQKGFQLLGALPLDSLTRGSTLGHRWGQSS